jgi:hypothetical protein
VAPVYARRAAAQHPHACYNLDRSTQVKPLLSYCLSDLDPRDPATAHALVGLPLLPVADGSMRLWQTKVTATPAAAAAAAGGGGGVGAAVLPASSSSSGLVFVVTEPLEVVLVGRHGEWWGGALGEGGCNLQLPKTCLKPERVSLVVEVI